MKKQKLLSILLMGLFVLGISIRIQVQVSGENRNPFEDADEK
jgi:hypothetical protein